jgi:hypothetical protein
MTTTTQPAGFDAAVKTVSYRKSGQDRVTGRVSVRTLKEMIARWELGPDDLIRIDGEAAERRIRESPALSPLDEMLAEASEKVLQVRRGRGRRVDVIRQLEVLREYAEFNDRVYSVATFLLGWLRYAENSALARGLFLKSLERGYPFTSVARNNLAVAQIRLGDPAGRDNLILAANDPHRVPAALFNLARLLQHLQGLGESTDEIASIKDILKVARTEWRKSPPALGDPASYALLLCDGDIPASFASESKALAQAQGQIEDILAEGEDCLRQGRLEQATAHAARAASEIDLAREELSRGAAQKGSPRDSHNPALRFLCVRLGRLIKGTAAARESRENKTQLELFRKRLRSIEESLRLHVPPADLIQQAEILLDSARTEGEKSEATNLLRECQERTARHLVETANDLLQAGEKEVAIGLLRRALTLEARESDEIKLRLASVKRDELVEEITRCIHARAFDEARVKIALLRTLHPIFEPVADRLESEVRNSEANVLLERVVTLCAARNATREEIIEARRLLGKAQTLHEDPSSLRPVEAALLAVEARFGLKPPARREAAQGPRPAPPGTEGGGGPVPGPSSTGFALDPPDGAEGAEKGQDFR